MALSAEVVDFVGLKFVEEFDGLHGVGQVTIM